MINLEIKDDILSIADDYETFFIDLYGVLFDGISFYKRALAALEALKAKGKKIILLSNSTQVSDEAKAGYSRKGMIQGLHYDEFITSGEFLYHIIKDCPEEFSRIMKKKCDSVKCIFMGNNGVFEKTHVRKVDIYEADFLYIGIPRASYGAVRIDDVWDCGGNKVNIEDVLESDWNKLQDSQGRRGFEEFTILLNNSLRLDKTLVVANPDIFALSSLNDSQNCGAIITQGAIAAYYEKLGGKVVYFGKPYAGIFEYAHQIANSKGPAVMVGDTPWTDISGANANGIDSALVTSTGIANEFIRRMDSSFSIEERFKALCEKITPKMTKLSVETWPTHFICRFSSS
ncbi:MAG: HAD hydrolase-like protein [Holosporaceae bacterium]|nr:HAD hydrolase-like protein [Holosporaceae bacterium]